MQPTENLCTLHVMPNGRGCTLHDIHEHSSSLLTCPVQWVILGNNTWAKPERVADYIWKAHTDMQLFVQPDYYGYTGMG